MTGSTLSRKTLLLMSFAVGATVANLYYNQPLLEQIRESFGASVQQVGLIPSLTQIGYAIGMLFLVPLGDMMDRRKLVVFFTILSAFAMALIAAAPFLNLVVAGSLFLGLATMTPQLLVPFAAHLAEPENRGKVVGTMMSGLLLGILLARTVSGFIGAAFGWRMMFGIAAAVLIGIAVMLHRLLPQSTPSYTGTYQGLLKSVLEIFREQPVLREACFFGAMFFGAFSAFWATLIHLMESESFHLGSRAVGLYGLLGAAAALLAPSVGSITDKHNPRNVTGMMFALTILSFLIFLFSGQNLFGIAMGVLLMDIGVQSGHVSNQGRIFGLLPNAHSRLQTAYMFWYFTGGAFGSWIASLAWSHYYWGGVCGVALLLLVAGMVRYLLPAPKKTRA